MKHKKIIAVIGFLILAITVAVKPETQTNAEETTVIEESNATVSSDDNIEEYSGQPYVILNNNEPYFTAEEKSNTTSFEVYSDLDSLGRCGVAYANICTELMPIEERGEIGNIKPSGWHTVNYHEFIDGNYLYNRCHLIGYQLSGENANEKNLITGTRYLNVTGMLPFENEVADYVNSTNNHVLYRVTPKFDGDNLVASGVEMEAYSVEDHGSGIKYNVYCYNVQPNISIDYATGDSTLEVSEATTSEQNITTEEVASEGDKQSEKVDTEITTEYNFVLNTNTKKIHYPSINS